MKAIIEKKKLMQALTHLHGVVEKRNTIPILANDSSVVPKGSKGKRKASCPTCNPAVIEPTRPAALAAPKAKPPKGNDIKFIGSNSEIIEKGIPFSEKSICHRAKLVVEANRGELIGSRQYGKRY